MRTWILSVFLLLGCGSDEHAPPPPHVFGTLIVEANLSLVLGRIPDEPAETAALQRQAVEHLRDRAFLRRIADDQHLDPAVMRHVSARAVKDSRLVELGVALDDDALAVRVCNAILDRYPFTGETGTISVLDRCAVRGP